MPLILTLNSSSWVPRESLPRARSDRLASLLGCGSLIFRALRPDRRNTVCNFAQDLLVDPVVSPTRKPSAPESSRYAKLRREPDCGRFDGAKILLLEIAFEAACARGGSGRRPDLCRHRHVAIDVVGLGRLDDRAGRPLRRSLRNGVFDQLTHARVTLGIGCRAEHHRDDEFLAA